MKPSSLSSGSSFLWHSNRDAQTWEASLVEEGQNSSVASLNVFPAFPANLHNINLQNITVQTVPEGTHTKDQLAEGSEVQGWVSTGLNGGWRTQSCLTRESTNTPTAMSFDHGK